MNFLLFLSFNLKKGIAYCYSRTIIFPEGDGKQISMRREVSFIHLSFTEKKLTQLSVSSLHFLVKLDRYRTTLQLTHLKHLVISQLFLPLYYSSSSARLGYLPPSVFLDTDLLFHSLLVAVQP
jgi:hypothetical protein